MSLRRSTRTAQAVQSAATSSVAANTAKPRSSSAGAAKRARAASVKQTPPAAPSTPSKRQKTSTHPSTSEADTTAQTPQAVRVAVAAYTEPSTTSNGVVSTTSASTPRARRVRPVQPHMTIAPLRTPRGSRIVAEAIAPTAAVPAPPQWNGAPNATADSGITTETLLEKAKAHLVACDPGLQQLVDSHHCYMLSPAGLAEEVDPFQALVSGILSQQVSGAAARAIKKRFIGLFNTTTTTEGEGEGVWPTPAQVAAADIATLRTAGLSQRKAEYVQGLAEKFASEELSARMLAVASDEEILEKLTAVRGLGRWSVEMFAFFALKRTDIFSTGDLGVQRGTAAYVGRDVAKLKAKGGGKWKYMSEQDMLDISAKFAPYRSLFMWYMWRFEDAPTDTAALENPSSLS